MMFCFISTTQTAAQTSCVLGDNQGLVCNSPVRYCVPLLPKHSTCERVRLFYCSGTFNFFYTQTTDFNYAICTETGRLINDFNKISCIFQNKTS